jgi:TolB-like protein/DNA-binding winged helix-turn-helix (wHTH) protein/Flp pilus assembly protein TadD
MASTGGSPGPHRYRFDDFVVDAAARALLRDGQPLPLEPKAFAVLLALVRHPGELLPRDDLLDQVWGHRHVTPGVLTRAIAQLRGALGDDPQHPRYIQTRHALGYCFVGTLSLESTDGDAVVVEASAQPIAGPGEAATPPHGPDSYAAGAAHHWRPRHWLLASLLAIALSVLIFYVESRRPHAPVEASIAVMPFANLGATDGADYFAEGLALEMHDALAGVTGLKVAAFPEVLMQQGADARTVGRLLGVATVLDATVRRDGGRLRINARLTDCRSGYTLWSRSYDRELEDVFDIQAEIALDVARSLARVLPNEQRALARRLAPTRSVAAFDAYLRGVQQLRRSAGEEDSARAMALFDEALVEDGSLAAAQLGICRTELWRYTNLNNTAALDRADAACARAEALDPGSARAQLLIGDIHRHRGELAPARERYDRIRDTPALRADVLLRDGMLHARDGNGPEALAAFQAARDARPGDAGIIGRIGFQLFRAGRVDDALAAYQEAARLRPEDAGLWASVGGIYLNLGRNDEALAAFERSLQIEPTALAHYNHGVLLFYLRRYGDSVQSLRRALAIHDEDYRTWGALGASLLAEPSSAATAASAFQRAIDLVSALLKVEGGDAFALASQGWYAAVLGMEDLALDSAIRAERLQPENGEVLLLNAQTHARLERGADAADRVARARAAGVPESRIRGNPLLGNRPDTVSPSASGGIATRP